MTGASFDTFAHGYDTALDRGISLSGESREYFARGRVSWLRACLTAMGCHPRRAMDYGCGTGTALPLLRAALNLEEVVGLDVSPESLTVAAEVVRGDSAIRLVEARQFRAEGNFDLVFTSGVFHHIPPSDRTSALDLVSSALSPGGVLAFWENNAWSPATRWVMRRIPFDRDAVPLSAREARALLRRCGFEIVTSDHLFVFPRALRWLRGLERPLSGLPLGAQFMVLARRPRMGAA